MKDIEVINKKLVAKYHDYIMLGDDDDIKLLPEYEDKDHYDITINGANAHTAFILNYYITAHHLDEETRTDAIIHVHNIFSNAIVKFKGIKFNIDVRTDCTNYKICDTSVEFYKEITEKCIVKYISILHDALRKKEQCNIKALVKEIEKI